jgi:hypothetical protein
MSVYVDDFRSQYRGMVMCHMLADTSAELDAMADKIGVQRKWKQRAGTFHEHYDICLTKRKIAVKNGAIEVDSRELVRIIKAKRA